MTFLAITAVLAALSALVAGLKLAEKSGRVHPEVLRKGLHIGTGLVALPLPWIFDRVWPVVVLAIIACSLIFAARSIPWLRRGIGAVLGSVGRESLGEIYFPIAVTVLFILSQGSWLLFVVPILMLTLADGTAALVGIRYGQVRLMTSEGRKSLEGSIAFFMVAFLSVQLPLLLFTDTGRVETILIATILAFLVVALESIAWRGLDNLFIPLGAYAFLHAYLGEDAQTLLIHLLIAVALTIFALAWRGRSKLDDSALIGCGLFGYTSAILGGWLWLLGPGVFFLSQVLFRPRSSDRRPHTVYSMLWASGASLFLVFLYSVTAINWLIIPFTASFACQSTLFGVSRIGLITGPGSHLWRVVWNVGLGWVLVHCPTLVIKFVRSIESTAIRSDISGLLGDLGLGLLGIGLAAAIFYRLMPRIYGPPVRAAAINPTFAVLGILAALVASLRWLF